MSFILTKEEVAHIKDSCKTSSLGFFDLYVFAKKLVEENELKLHYQTPEGLKELLEGKCTWTPKS
jgi:hypothetical protein